MGAPLSRGHSPLDRDRHTGIRVTSHPPPTAQAETEAQAPSHLLAQSGALPSAASRCGGCWPGAPGREATGDREEEELGWTLAGGAQHHPHTPKTSSPKQLWAGPGAQVGRDR